ncbi:MAG: ATP-dependent protease, partial [Candidatus Aenigmarchaeota archaeon]|nr:ATP-dependent protease [Candidatus Aenigmarchaeota archaeon]
TISVLEQKELKENVIITGSVNENGTIGPVGSIYEKAEAAKNNGAKLFLVPKNSSIEIETKPSKVCEDKDGIEYCETKYVETSTNIGEAVGIMVLEVSNIQEAMNYMIIP